MRKGGYYKQDWFIALLVGIAFALALLSGNPFLERLELLAYDLGVKLTHRTAGAADQIVIVAIDDASIAEIGRWPWPRDSFAPALQHLAKAEPRAVTLLLDLTEPHSDAGLSSIRAIREKLSRMTAPRQTQPALAELRALLNQAEQTLDTDRALAQALRPLPRLYLPMYTDAVANGEANAPDYIERYQVTNVVFGAGVAATAYRSAGLRAPLETFGRYASGIGHLDFRTDVDDGVRAIHHVVEYDGRYYASLPLLLAASALGLDARQIGYDVDRGLEIGKLFVPVDRAGLTYPGYYAPPPGRDRAFSTYSFLDIQQDRLAPSLFTDKIVVIGVTASGAAAMHATPITTAAPTLTLPRLWGKDGQGEAADTTDTDANNDPRLSEPELVANFTASILNEDYYIASEWNRWTQPGIALAVMLYLLLGLARMRGKTALLVSALLLIGLLGTEQFLMVTQKLWLQTTTAATLLCIGYIAIAMKRFVLGERHKAQADSLSSERMLGLALQSQGQLDMAMDKFRALPVDASVLDLIYHLALDFERKRQFHKAAAAYDYILEHDRGFRDCVARRKRASQGDATLAFGKTLILDGAEKPTLGRYRIEKEIGRGEMGVVYLGLDPKINRRVAIKTMALSPEMGAKDLGNVRERFFREAETAGRLHHPNIVTVYDVGEEHDLAYIAMEYLDGKELATYIDSKKPLSFDFILDIAIKVADALAYAHRRDVVHRDIKPHNIFYDEATGGVKVMDFGIARINAANRTKTGLVLGTPAYMSPEQVSGKRVDGRSDLFSFGCMLFELITGDTPFNGDSFAALTHQIINAPTPDIRKFRRDTPARFIAIVKRLLQKHATKRYQSGDEVKADLEQCRATLAEATKA